MHPTHRTRRYSRWLSAAAAIVSVACAGGSPRTDHRDAAAPPKEQRPDAAAPAQPRDAARATNPPDDGGSRSTDARPASLDATAPAEPDATTTADASDGFACHGPGSRFATGAPSHSFGPGQNSGQDQFPAQILGPPKAGAACQGSTDVVSLGNGGWVVVEFAGNVIVDRPGPDFIVFENPFEIGCDPNNIFAELGTVGVSQDGVHFTDFPCTATMPPYGECSGWHPVYANADTNDIDPTDPAVAGGDAYDLADIGLEWARYVRVTDRPDLTGTAGVYDLDAVSIVHPGCP